MSEANYPGVTVVGVNHLLKEKLSIVHLQWNDDSGRKLFLPVPFGVSLDDLRAEAEKALREAAAEHAAMSVSMSE
jgi:hypothetical protein